MITFLRGRRQHHDDYTPNKADRAAARFSTHELRSWGSQVSTYLAQTLEKTGAHPDEEEGEIAEAITALQAVQRELRARRHRYPK